MGDYLAYVVVYFPLGLLALIGGEEAGWVGLIMGYLIYLSILIAMLKRRKWEILKYSIMAFVLILILNIVGCLTGINNMGNVACM